MKDATRKRLDTRSTIAVVRRVLSEHASKHAKSYAVALFFMAVVAACTSLTAWITKDLVNAAVTKSDASFILYFPLLIASIFVVKGIFSYLQNVTVARIGARIVGDIQRQFYNHLLRMDIAFFQARSSSEITIRLTNGANAVRDAINLTAMSFGRDLLTAFGLCAVMVIQDPVLFCIVLTTIPIAYVLLQRLTTAAKRAAQAEAGEMASIISLTRETSQGARMLKSFQLENLLSSRMDIATQQLEARRNRLARLKAGVVPLTEVLSGFAISGVVFYAAWRSQGDPQSLGSLFSFITALLLAGEPLRRLSRLQIDLATAAERISMLYQILDMKPAEPVQADARELVVKKGEVKFDQVSFSYGSGKSAIRNVDLIFPGGKITALVGPSGGGKTTILGLMQALYRPDAGIIAIDDTLIDTVSLASLRSKIAYLDQEAFLFEGTIEDNIVGSCPVRDHERVIMAARSAGANFFIEAMKNGYQTEVQELANNLSGGQRQRIAIARAFYKDAPILLLDEPTSALDSSSEQHIRRAILSLAEGRTTIVVAHRLSTVQQADLIYVVDEGRVVEAGTHQELLVRGGHYAALFRSQMAHEDDTETTGLLRVGSSA